MAFIILFSLTCVVFPLAVEIAKKGKENTLNRAASQLKEFTSVQLSIAFSTLRRQESSRKIKALQSDLMTNGLTNIIVNVISWIVTLCFLVIAYYVLAFVFSIISIVYYIFS